MYTCACMLSCFSCVRLCDPMDSCQASLSVGILHKNTGVGCQAPLQEIFPTQVLNPHLLHWQADSLLALYMYIYSLFLDLLPI